MDKTITYHCGLFWEPLADGHSEQADFDVLDKLARGEEWTAKGFLGYASCSGLVINSLWHEEYKVISDKPLTKDEAKAKGVPDIMFRL